MAKMSYTLKRIFTLVAMVFLKVTNLSTYSILSNVNKIRDSVHYSIMKFTHDAKGTRTTEWSRNVYRRSLPSGKGEGEECVTRVTWTV